MSTFASIRIRTEGMLKIAITGPESSGKTTLASALSAYYNAPWVPEYAREYLSGSTRAYTEADLLNIAKGQAGLELKAMNVGANLLICDTDMITIGIWSKEKFGRVDPALERMIAQVRYDLVLLCKPDIPWEPDPLRENPLDRDRLFEVYRVTLDQLMKPYAIMEGDVAYRLREAVELIDGAGG